MFPLKENNLHCTENCTIAKQDLKMMYNENINLKKGEFIMNITIVNPSQIPNEDKVFIEKNLEFLTPSDVAELMDISIDNTRLLFHRDDFPTIMNGKNMLVLKDAFYAWCFERRE